MPVSATKLLYSSHLRNTSEQSFGSIFKELRFLGLKTVVEKYREKMPALSAFLGAHCEECFTVFALPAEHRIRMRTTNPLERLNKEIRRRTKVIGVFPTEPSLLLPLGVILNKISDDWTSSKIYLNPKSLSLANPIYRKNVASPDATEYQVLNICSSSEELNV